MRQCQFCSHEAAASIERLSRWDATESRVDRCRMRVSQKGLRHSRGGRRVRYDGVREVFSSGGGVRWFVVVVVAVLQTARPKGERVRR